MLGRPSVPALKKPLLPPRAGPDHDPALAPTVAAGTKYNPGTSEDAAEALPEGAPLPDVEAEDEEETVERSQPQPGEEQADAAAAPERAPAGEVAAPTEAIADIESIEVEAEPEDTTAEAAPAEPAKRMLPRPKPGKSRAGDFQSSKLRSTPPPLSGNVPKGIKPPRPEPVETEDTDVIIAALGAELIDEPEPDAEPDRDESGSAAAVGPDFGAVPAAAALEAPPRQRTPWMWIGVGGLAAAFILGIALNWGDDDAPKAAEDAPTAYSASMSAKPGNDSGETKKKTVAKRDEPIVAPPDPDPDADPVADPGTVEGAEPEEVEPEDVEPEEPEPEEPEPEEPEPELEDEGPPDPPTEAEHNGGGGKRRHGKTKRRDKGQSTSPQPVSSSSPAPSKKSSSDNSAEDLLAQAEQALRAGKNSTAYSLASRSRSKKRTTKALQIMAKAGCRMGSANKAKAAFDQLSLGARAGIRNECRKKGVKLGI